MFKTSRDFVIPSLDGSRAVEDFLEEGQRATALSIVDYYMGRPDSSHLNSMLEFAHQYSMPKTLGAEPTPRSRHIVVIPLYVSPDPAGEKYEQYCRQLLMQHKFFRQMDDLLAGYDNYVDGYAAFLQSGHIPPCLEEDMYCLLQLSKSTEENVEDTEVSLCL